MHLSNQLANMFRAIRYETSLVSAILAYGRYAQCDFGDYFDYESGKGMISYVPKNRLEKLKMTAEQTSDFYTYSGRQLMKPGRAVKAIYEGGLSEYVGKQNPSDHAIEIFTNKFKSLDTELIGEVVIVEGEDIRYWYDERNYEPNQYSLNESCMRYASRSSFFDVYVENPELIKLLIVVSKETGKLLGRAILWTLPEGTFVDRIYGSQITEEFVKNYALRRGWYVSILHSGTLWHTASGRVEKNVRVQLNQWKFVTYPYLDTMRYLDWETGTLYNYPVGPYTVYLDGTDGDDHDGFEDLFIYCYNCDELYDRSSTCPNCVTCEACQTIRYADEPTCGNCARFAHLSSFNDRAASFAERYNNLDNDPINRFRFYDNQINLYTNVYRETENYSIINRIRSRT